jgi:alkanesulfonate monooxygenase SsuD/methylene tetrahydromethanopterin reductase-like flavin-dependent oxidoreductase (luciferase family)
VLGASIVGSAETVRSGIEALLRRTQADELMANAQVYDHQARIASFEIVAEVRDRLGGDVA